MLCIYVNVIVCVCVSVRSGETRCVSMSRTPSWHKTVCCTSTHQPYWTKASLLHQSSFLTRLFLQMPVSALTQCLLIVMNVFRGDLCLTHTSKWMMRLFFFLTFSAKVRFHLSDAAPFSTLTCKRSPSRAHRLRSKRSLLRLRVKERESDTEGSQKETIEGTEDRWREENGETESERVREAKEKVIEREGTEEERKQDGENTEKTEMPKEKEEKFTSVNLQSAAERSPLIESPLTKLLGVNVPPPPDQSALRKSPSSSFHSSPSDHSNPSNETLSQSCPEPVNQVQKTPGNTDYITSCTLIEGLPFPVEYYVRTTRRMASAHSPVDLNAVIQSQLSNGRGRRRSNRSRLTSQPSSEKPQEKRVPKKRGPRGRRGRRRACESDSSGQSESLLQSPSSPQTQELIPSSRQNSDAAPDSQLHLSWERSPESGVYPIFRKRRGRPRGSQSQSPASINGNFCNIKKIYLNMLHNKGNAHYT